MRSEQLCLWHLQSVMWSRLCIFPPQDPIPIKITFVISFDFRCDVVTQETLCKLGGPKRTRVWFRVRFGALIAKNKEHSTTQHSRKGRKSAVPSFGTLRVKPSVSGTPLCRNTSYGVRSLSSMSLTQKCFKRVRSKM